MTTRTPVRAVPGATAPGTGPRTTGPGTTGPGAARSSPGSGPRPARGGRRRGDAGMATAEYAIATLAACGFAALLVAILASGEVRALLLGLVQRALSVV